MRLVTTSGGKVLSSPWFTAEEAAAYLRIESSTGTLHAFYMAYPRMGIPAYRLKGGRALRFRQADLDAALETATTIEPAGRKASDADHGRTVRALRAQGAIRRRG